MSNPCQLGKKENKSNQKKISEKNSLIEESKETQFYLITLEDSNGEHQQIRIFKNSDAAEIAFNFCKDNNLDYKSMKYIKKNIQKIIEKFDEPNHKLFFLDNSYSSIQEVEEENMVSENTLLDNEANKEKNVNKNRIKEIKFGNNFSDKEKNISDEINEENILEKNKINENKDIINTDINKNLNSNLKEENDYKNDNFKIKDNNIGLIIKSNNIKEFNEKIKKNSKFHINNEDLIKPINSIQNNNKIEMSNDTNDDKQEPKNNNNIIKPAQKRKDSLKIDFNLLKAKMNDIRLKNSVLKIKNERNKDNLTEKKIYNKTENNSKSKNNLNNIDIKKQHLLKDKINNYKKGQNINENIIDK